MFFSTGARTISTQTLKKIMIDIDPLMFEQTGEPKPLFPDHTQGEYRGYRGGRLVSPQGTEGLLTDTKRDYY